MAHPQPAILANLENASVVRAPEPDRGRRPGGDQAALAAAARRLRARRASRPRSTSASSSAPRCSPTSPTTSPTTSSRTRATSRPTARSPRAPRKSCSSGSTPTARTSSGRRSSTSARPSPGTWPSPARRLPGSTATASTSRGSSTAPATRRPRSSTTWRSCQPGRRARAAAFCIAQRWVHDLDYFNSLSLDDQENLFGRTQGRLDPSRRAAAHARTSPTSSCARVRRPTPPSPSGARWCAAPRRTPCPTAPSACTSWASARSRRRCASAWRRSTA